MGSGARTFAYPGIVLGSVALILHVFVNQHYDFFRDELYFIVCGRHPAWGYVDQLFDLAALALVMPFAPLRRAFFTPWPYFATLVAATIISPNVIWQWNHGWPFLEIGAAGATTKNMAMSLPAYLVSQVVLLNPAAAIVWIAGLIALALSPRWRLYRVFALQYGVLIVIEVLTHGKDYYAFSLYPTLFAFGAAATENAVSASMPRAWLASLIVAVGAMAAPIAIPLLPVDRFIAYEAAIGYRPSQSEHRELAALPLEYADMFGWREMAKSVSNAYWALPDEQRANAVFMANNYGEAAAIDVFGDRLPPAISGHNNYFLWGPRGHDGAVVIALVRDPEKIKAKCKRVGVGETIDNSYAMPDETKLHVVVCIDLNASLKDDWAQFKNYN